MKARATSGKGKSIRERFRLQPFTNPSGETVWRVTGTRPDGTRVRENYPTKAEATGRKGELGIEAENIKAELPSRLKSTRLTDAQVRDAEAALTKLSMANRPGVSLIQAVQFYLDNYSDPVKRGTVREAFELFITERKSENLRPASIESLEDMNRELVRLYGDKQVAEILPDTIRPLIHKPTRSPTSRDTYRRGIHAFLAWAAENGYCRSNPCANIKRPQLERGEPVVLTVAECSALLDAAGTFKAGALLPYLALGLFAGLRPTELARLEWSRVDLEQGTVIIGSDVAKMRSRRVVALSPNLCAILRPLALRRVPIVAPNWRKDFNAVKEAAGFGTPTKEDPTLKPWTQDIMRHTAISMHLAKHQHEGHTAAWAGNSPDVIQKHYKGLVRPGDAEAFWSLTVTGNPANVVPLAVAA